MLSEANAARNFCPTAVTISARAAVRNCTSAMARASLAGATGSDRSSGAAQLVDVAGVALHQHGIVGNASGYDRELVFHAIVQRAFEYSRPARKWDELISRSQPVLAGAARIGGQDNLSRNAMCRTQDAEQTINGRWIRNCPAARVT